MAVVIDPNHDLITMLIFFSRLDFRPLLSHHIYIYIYIYIFFFSSILYRWLLLYVSLLRPSMISLDLFEFHYVSWSETFETCISFVISAPSLQVTGLRVLLVILWSPQCCLLHAENCSSTKRIKASNVVCRDLDIFRIPVTALNQILY